MILAVVIALSGGVYETTILIKYIGNTEDATIRYLKTNRFKGTVSYCYLNTYDNVFHNGNCTARR